MEGNECLGCRFSSVKVAIDIPDRFDLARFARETKQYTRHLAAKAKKKRIHYTLVFDSEHQNDSNLDFNMHCQCILNVKRHDCSKFNSAGHIRVKHLQRSQGNSGLNRFGVAKRFL